ncbi:MAG: hypothetical protein RLO50_22995 [Azospirillaceae bacterium]
MAAIAEERARVFEQMRRQPDNLDLMFAYAQLSSALGELEAAAATFERMLLYNPDLPRVRLELSLLYFRLGSYPSARAYVTEVLAEPDLPEQVRTNAELLLARIEEAEDPSRFFASAFAGIRWQSNANAGPANPEITLSGIDLVLDDEATEQSDFSAIGSLRFGHVYDLGFQDGTVWRSSGELTYVDYFELDSLDQLYVRAETGPQIPLTGNEANSPTVWPRAVGELFVLDSEVYFEGIGGGLNGTLPLDDNIVLFARTEAVWRDFEASPGNPTNDLRDGFQGQVELELLTRNEDGLVFGASGLVRRVDAAADFFALMRYAGDVSLAYEFSPDGAPVEGDWTAGVRAGYRYDDYDAPDPGLDPNVIRRDREWSVGAFVSFPLLEDVYASIDLDYRDVNSTLDIYEYDVFTVTVGVQLRL